MPNLGLSPEDATSVAAYLAELGKRGDKVMAGVNAEDVACTSNCMRGLQ
jgi:hypothetical protein